MGMKTMFCTLEGPANALATNREANQVVVAGRNVFKIFSIEEDEFVEKLNLRVGKNLNLNFSCADVVWNAVDDHILATAATNGAVLTWNINKTSRSKQDMVFQDHKRTVNKVSFHATEPHLLLSGSQDGTMKCFDLRRKEATTTFHSLSESVRDVQFSPHQHFVFAAVQENGNVQLWDLRRPDRYDKQFTAHNGPVFSCNWHPEERKWLATAGRDKTIKVWDIGSKPSLEHCIQTIASVAHIKWRPQRKHNIASSSLVVDFSINIWDIRRPYIPFASFNEHKDVATGFAWRQDPHVFLSTSKDCTLYQHVFRDAVRPADRAIPVGLAMNNHFDILYAVSDRIAVDNQVAIKIPSYNSTRLPSFFRKLPSLGEQFRSAFSYLMTFSNYQEDKDHFMKSATMYILSGPSFNEICDHNASVAAELKRTNIAQAWRMLKLMYPGSPSAASLAGAGDALWSNGDKGNDTSHDGNNQRHSRHNSGNMRPNRHVSGAPSNSDRISANANLFSGDTPGATEDDSDASDQDHDRTLTNIVSCMGSNTLQGDFFFGDGETDHTAFFEFNSPLPPMEDTQDWTLPTEAFQPRHAIKDYSPPSDTANIPSTPTNLEDDELEAENEVSPILSGEVEDHSKFLTSSALLTMPTWLPSETVKEILQFYANQGDIQTAVSLLIVLGDRAGQCVDDATQEHWFTAYIELLGRYQLWNVANRIIQHCKLPSISSLNQQSTVMHMLCGSCRKPLTRAGWLCDRCKTKNFPSSCSVCHQIVRGLYVWCQGCCHGGHLQHLAEWLQENPSCPAGCGHKCQYT